MFNLNVKAMKKVVKFLLVAFLGSFLVVASAMASVNKLEDDVKASKNSIREQLVTTLSDVTVNDKSEIYVYFTVSTKNGFELISVAGENSGLTNVVEKLLKTNRIEVPTYLEGKYLVKVIFVNR